MRAIEFLTEGATDVMEHLEEIVKESQQFLGQYPSIKTFMSEAVSDLINYPSKEQSKIHQQYDISRNKKYADQTDRQSGQQKTDIDYITDYTAGDSYDINDYLHRHYRKKASKNDLAKYKKNLQSIDRALTVQRLTKPLTVYTAVPESPANAWTIYGADIRLPIRLHLPAYTSTSTSLESVIEFASRSHLAPDSVDHKRHPPRNSKKAPDDIDTNQIIMLQIPVGTPAASVKGISDYPDENEILMPRGLDIEISPNPTVIKYGDYVWHAQVLGHNPIQIIASEGVQNIEEMAGEKNKCPPATQDITLNLKNRQKAIDEYGYGPLNPDMPNRKFWMKKVDEWNLDSIQEAQQSLCGNCAAFDIRQETLDCIAQGIDSGNPQDAQGVIDAGDLGYCKFLKFKCASRRTCDAWVTGGPLVDKQGMAEGKITLSTDPNWYGATVDNYQASGPVVNIPANQLVGFEPDDKMNQPKSKVNVEKIVAGLKQGAKLPPLLVRKYKNGYQVLDGHHRFWAYKLLGVKSIPAQIVPDSDIEEISKQGMAEGLNFDEIYGKYLKVTDNNGDPGKPGFSLVTPLNGDSWNWRERPEFKDLVKQKLNDPGFLGDHKYQQIIDAMSGKQFDPTKHIAKENFADGKNPGRKGLSKRVGVNTKASVSSLRKTAKNSSGEKQRMAHWLANMKAGRAKAKRK